MWSVLQIKRLNGSQDAGWVFGHCDELPWPLQKYIYLIDEKKCVHFMFIYICSQFYFFILCTAITLDSTRPIEVWDPEHKNEDVDGMNQNFGADQKLIIKTVSRKNTYYINKLSENNSLYFLTIKSCIDQPITHDSYKKKPCLVNVKVSKNFYFIFSKSDLITTSFMPKAKFNFHFGKFVAAH